MSSATPDRQVTASLGVAATRSAGRVSTGSGDADQVVVHLGPGHPTSHGALRLRLALAGDRIVRCEPEVGFLHRGAEKLFEVRDYRQAMMLANRHDWLSAYAGELGLALVVERMLGMEVPPRATWVRTLLAELHRAAHHLAFLGALPPEMRTPVAADADPGRRLLLARERLLGALEELAGGRMHLMLTRVGGLKEDAPAGWLARTEALVARLLDELPDLLESLLGDPEVERRTRGVGRVSAGDVEAYGLTGPMARAAGVPLDLRRDEPSLAYAELAAEGLLAPVTGADGDAWTRLRVLAEETTASLRLAQACLDHVRGLPAGPVSTRLPKVLKAPEGSAYGWTEGPGGVTGYYLVSRGEKTPWRLKLRTPGFATAAALPVLLAGARVADLVPVLASTLLVVGDVDK